MHWKQICLLFFWYLLFELLSNRKAFIFFAWPWESANTKWSIVKPQENVSPDRQWQEGAWSTINCFAALLPYTSTFHFSTFTLGDEGNVFIQQITWVKFDGLIEFFFKSLLKYHFFRGSLQGSSDVCEWKQYSFAWLWIKLLNSAGAVSEPRRECLMGKML